MQIEENAVGSNMAIGDKRVNENTLAFNIWVTTSCNYACSYCYEGAKKKSIFMDVETANRTVEFVEYISKREGEKNIDINFHGGEPTLNSLIIEHIMNRIKDKSSMKVHTTMTTNCSEFYEEGIQIIDELTLSIDGNRITHDKNRKWKNGRGTFDRSFHNALLYLGRHSNIKVNLVITSHTVEDVYDNVFFLVDSGFKIIVPHVDYYDTEWNENNFETLYEQFKRIKDELRNQNLQDVQVGLLEQVVKRKSKCIVGKTQFQIYPDGSIYPCAVVAGNPKYCFGNVVTGIDETRVKYLNSLMNPQVYECADCKYYDYCATCRCYFVNETLTGSMYVPSGVVCAMEHLKIRLMRMG